MMPRWCCWPPPRGLRTQPQSGSTTPTSSPTPTPASGAPASPSQVPTVENSQIFLATLKYFYFVFLCCCWCKPDINCPARISFQYAHVTQRTAGSQHSRCRYWLRAAVTCIVCPQHHPQIVFPRRLNRGIRLYEGREVAKRVIKLIMISPLFLLSSIYLW